MESYGDLGGCYPPRPTASKINTLLDLHNSSEDTQPHSLIVELNLDKTNCRAIYLFLFDNEQFEQKTGN